MCFLFTKESRLRFQGSDRKLSLTTCSVCSQRIEMSLNSVTRVRLIKVILIDIYHLFMKAKDRQHLAKCVPNVYQKKWLWIKIVTAGKLRKVFFYVMYRLFMKELSISVINANAQQGRKVLFQTMCQQFIKEFDINANCGIIKQHKKVTWNNIIYKVYSSQNSHIMQSLQL